MATPNLGSSVLASKTKTKKKHFVAQKVKLFRASDPLLSVLMWGVNHSMPGERTKCSEQGLMWSIDPSEHPVRVVTLESSLPE
ncbi:hypothetical protein MJT46_011177 [Ovis ammon polii x Ovis aries]|nr:hypothetical protein MJT46_011177 [Ovis ammon polii x Ovis aries]